MCYVAVSLEKTGSTSSTSEDRICRLPGPEARAACGFWAPGRTLCPAAAEAPDPWAQVWAPGANGCTQNG